MNTFEKCLLTIFFIELFVGGGGRLIDFGVLSIREVIFVILILTFIVRIIKTKAILDKQVNTFIRWNPITVGIYLLLVWIFMSAVIGLLYKHSPSIVATDFFRVSFFAAYFPLAYYISEKRFTKQRIILILKYSALAVSIFTIMIALLGKTVFYSNFETYTAFWKQFMHDDLLFRRSHSVFYKSHFYVLVGLVVSLNDVLSKKYSKVDILNIILCSISIFWSDTRGLSIALMVSVLMILIIDIKVFTDTIIDASQKIKAVLKNSMLIKKSIILLIITVSVPFLYKYMTLARFQSASGTNGTVNDTSVGARLAFLSSSKEILLSNPLHLIFGEGYGTSIAGRVTGIEMSFLEILIEQGVIGLAMWLFLCLLVFYNYYQAYKKGTKINTHDISLLGAFVGILLLTNINPFINNPIGIIFFLMMLIFSQNKRDIKMA
jgi:O-antigen ligase